MHKKRLIAAVVGGMLAAPAAFAQITISGTIKDGLEMYKLGAGNAGAAAASSYHYEPRVSDQSSRIIFSGTQDLGGGTRAWFQLDSRFQSDVGGSTQNANGSVTTGINLWAGGNTGVGLAGDWGKLTIGRWDLHYLEFIPIEFGYAGSLQDLLGAGPMAQVNGNNTTSLSANVIANGTRTPNVIMWDSANMGGFTARVAYSTAFTTNLTGVSSDEGSGKGGAGSSGGAVNAALRYAGGPLALGASVWSATPEGGASSPAGQQKSVRVWGGYTLPMGLKVGLGFDGSQRRQAAGEAMTKRNAFMVPLAYNFGSHTAYLTLVKVGKLSGPNAAQPTDSTDATAFALGWEYALSKLTTFGAFYAKIDNKANANYNFFSLSANGATPATAGESAAQLYAGFSYRF